MQNIEKLSDLSQGKHAFVIDIHSNDSMRRRLQDLGLIKGTKVSCIGRSPLGDPAAYLIRGAVIALRRVDSSCVQVQKESAVFANDGNSEREVPSLHRQRG